MNGWRDLITIINEEDRFDAELFADTYLETFERLKPYVTNDLIPKDIVRLLCDVKVFACADTAPNEGYYIYLKAQLLTWYLYDRVLSDFNYRMNLSINHDIDADEVTDDKIVWIEGIENEGPAEIIDISDFKKRFEEFNCKYSSMSGI